MEMSELELSQMISSRLNHDYVAPLTAISNSCELMKLSPESTRDCLELINDSVESAIALLQFYRLAFGGYGDNEEMSYAEARRKYQDIIHVNDTTLNFGRQPVAIQKRVAKLLALSMLCLRSSFSKLESVNVDQIDGRWIIEGRGRPRDDQKDIDQIEALWLGKASSKPSNIHFAVLALELQRQRVQFTRNKHDERLIILEIVG